MRAQTCLSFAAIVACGPKVARDLPATDTTVALDTARHPVSGAPATGSRTAATDSLSGAVSVVGAEPATMVMLAVGGGKGVRLEGTELARLGRVSGLEVTVYGSRTDSTAMRVARFIVRRANGLPARDGVLRLDGASVMLVGADGTSTPVINAPVELRSLAGARVWVSGPPSKAPDAFGVIEPAR